MEVVEIGGGEAPLDFGIAAEGAGAGAGSVEEDAVEGTGERKSLSAVKDQQVSSEVLELGDAVEVEIAGGDTDAGFEGLGGLVAGGGTEIEEGLAGGELEQGDDGLRPDVLGASGADVFFGLLEGGAGDCRGRLEAEVAFPAGQQPFGTGELDFAGRPSEGVAIDLAEDGVDEAGGGTFAGAFDEIDGIGDGGVGRHALQVAELVNGHAEGDADFGIELLAAAGIVLDQVIELGAEAEDAEDDFGGEGSVAGIERGGVSEQEVRGPGTGFDAAEDVEGEDAGGCGHEVMVAVELRFGTEGKTIEVKQRRVLVRESQSTIRVTRGMQLPLIAPPRLPRPATPVEAKGVVYTKRWVVELLLDLAGYRSENNLVDAVAVEPAAGDGAFLVPMVERLVQSCKRLGRSLSECQGALIAYELDDESADRARALAIGVLTDCGVQRPLAECLAASWVRAGDYLFESTNIEADFVIGNPPYIRLEDIPEETATLYRNSYPTMRGRADVYVAFFEAALHQLKEGGVCAFICADRWMRNQYGAELRELVTSAYSVEVVIEMHNANAFHDEVDAYPAITVIRRQDQGLAVIASAGPGAEKIAPGTLLATLQATARNEAVALPQDFRAALVETWFQGADPWPCHSPEQLTLLRSLERRFPALESNAKVGIGVATGNDGLFITKDPRLVEPSRLLKLALAEDLRGGTMNWSGHYLVNPWNSDGLVALDQYPRLLAYFEEHAVALKKRHTATKNLRAWYRTIDRVTHTLTSTPKLYIADIKNLLDPVLDPGETYPHHNLYFIQSDEWDLEVLGGLLMSSVGQFFVESYGVRMRGGYLRFQAQYLRRIRVPNPKALSVNQSEALIEAFRMRDRQRATQVALEVYGIDEHEMEIALGH